MKNQKSINTVLEMQNAFKDNGIETRKLPRSAALRVSFMGSFFRVTHAGEGKGWLVNGYNEDGDPVKISELRSLCEELSPVAGNSEPSNSQPAQVEELATDEAADVAINPVPGEDAIVHIDLTEILESVEEDAITSEEPSQGEELASLTPGQIVLLDVIDAIAPPTDQITGKAITLQQPWAWAVTHLEKNIENRTWPTTHRGEIFIHAGKGWDANGAAWIEQNFNVEIPPQSQMASGELVAKCEIVDCQHWSETKEHHLPWSQKFGFQWFLEDIEVLETPIPLRGKLGIFPFSVVDPKAMDPNDVDSNAWCVANSPIADDEIDDFGVPGTKVGSFTMLPTREDEAAVRRRHLVKRIYEMARRTGVKVSDEESAILDNPEKCPMADLEKLLNQLLTLPPVSAGIDWWHPQDDDGEPINYRPTAEIAS